MNCSFTLTKDGRPLGTLEPGDYTVVVTTPVPFANPDQPPGIVYLPICDGAARFSLDRAGRQPPFDRRRREPGPGAVHGDAPAERDATPRSTTTGRSSAASCSSTGAATPDASPARPRARAQRAAPRARPPPEARRERDHDAAPCDSPLGGKPVARLSPRSSTRSCSSIRARRPASCSVGRAAR